MDDGSSAALDGTITNAVTGKAGWNKRLHYVDFDFHKECAGMKFENVRCLIVQMQETLQQMDYFHQSIRPAVWAAGGRRAHVHRTQKGAFRVSCLDCLDRTNVVQSAFARHVLTGQLQSIGIAVGAPSPANAATV
jgi:hypothetical protein